MIGPLEAGAHGETLPQVAADMKALTAQGVNSFKFFLAYKGALMVTDDELLHGLQQCKAVGALAQVSDEL